MQLLEAGWRVLEVWECTLKGKKRFPVDEVLIRCAVFLNGEENIASIGVSKTVTTEAGKPDINQKPAVGSG